MADSSSYPISILKESHLTAEFRCWYCHHLLNDPYQFPCGHRLCRQCVLNILKDKEEEKCFQCVTEDLTDVGVVTRGKYQLDYTCKRKMSELEVYCLYKRDGCLFEGFLRQLQDHLSTCGYKKVVCECVVELMKNELIAHQERGCPRAQESRCRFGCPNDAIAEGTSQEDHDRESVPQHVSLLRQDFSRTKHQLTQQVQGLENTLNQIESQHHEGASATGGAVADSAVSHSIVPSGDINSNNSANSQGPVSSGGRCVATLVDGRTLVSTAGNTFVEDTRRKMRVMDQKVRVSHNLFSVLFKEVEQADRRFTSLESHLADAVAERQRQQEQMRRTLDGVDRSTNGVLLWEIEDVRRRYMEAQTVGHASIMSLPFYTSRAGYKLCGRIYLRGDGIGRGQFISLFIIMMKGKYDSFLRWPFNQFVTLTLIDQSGKSQHVRDSFRTDPGSDSFQRPLTEMNIASGCPRFMNLQHLNNRWEDYVHDDRMLIEIRVDTQGLENYGGQ